MQTQTQIETEPLAEEAGDIPRWNLFKRIAFRFAFAYLVLYNLPFPLGFLPLTDYLAKKYSDLWDLIVLWVGKNILHIGYDIITAPTGSGDRTYDYVLVLCCLTLAVVATVVWSLFDRRRFNYATLHKWLRLYVRFALANWMIIYGTIKAIPLQFPRPFLSRLVQPYGESSPMGLLWTFMGASPSYVTITGCIELLGGILLIIPRTTMMGAIVSLGAMTQIFILNMCYDVPVKLFSFHLMLLAIFLLAPDLRRMANLFIFNRPVDPAQKPRFFERQWLNRGILILQLVFGLYLIGSNLYSNYYGGYKTYGGGAPKPPFYGIWSVEEFAVDGEARAPLITDQLRWQRAIFQFPGSFIIQPMSGPNIGFRLQLDTENKKMSLVKVTDPESKADLSFEEPEPGVMTLDGDFEGRKIHARLLRADESKFLLRNRGFHWIQERPFNR